jgi:LL-diaminopimelate aminotransferase
MVIQSSNRVGQIKEYYFSKKLREVQRLKDEGNPIINLAIGNPDLPPIMDVIEVLNDAALGKDNHGYQSYKGLPELRNAFADWYYRYYYVNLNPDKEILPLMGSKEGIMHISLAFLNPGDEVLIPDPGYPAYASASEIVGAKVVKYDLSAENNWLPDFDELEKMDLSKVKIMWLNYPHMPTGTPSNEKLFKELIDFGIEHDILICNDNPYSFILNDNPTSILSMPEAKEVCLELNSLSKSHNMAGWRVGMIAGAEEYINAILKIKSNFDSGMFKPIQLAAVRALQNHESWYSHLNLIYKNRKELIMEILDLLQCTYEKDQNGMFIWAKVPDKYKSGEELSDYLLHEKNVFAAPGSVFGNNGKNYIRFSLCVDTNAITEVKRRIMGRTGFKVSPDKKVVQYANF